MTKRRAGAREMRLDAAKRANHIDKFWSAIIRPGQQVTETAAQAHARLLAEAHRRLCAIEQAIKGGAPANVDWGHVGSLNAVVENLGLAGHYAGVPELTEK